MRIDELRIGDEGDVMRRCILRLKLQLLAYLE